MKSARLLSVGLVSFVGVWAHGQAPDLSMMDLVLRSVPDGPVARVGDRNIPPHEFRDLYMGEIMRYAEGAGTKEVSDEIRIGIALNGLRVLIEREILFQEAQRRKISITDEELNAKWNEELEGLRRATTKSGEQPLTEAQILERAGTTRDDALVELRRAMMIDAIRDAITAEKGLAVTDQEVNEWYEKNKEQTRRPDMIHLKQIYIKADTNRKDVKADAAGKRAHEAYDRIKSGQSFEGVCRAVSDGQKKEDGGDWGLLPAKDFPEFIADAAYKLQPGEVSAPIESEYGYHILKLVEIVPGQDLSIDEIQTDIKDYLLARKSTQAIREFCSKTIQDTTQVQVYLDLEKQLKVRPELLESLAGQLEQPAAVQPKPVNSGG